ncbi:coiled-coil and C2 domain-containing protein 1-like isoform X2 [Ylistrum balloti]|uniref:coiled-coil and C2 domain-containing protein 1-like isoform X2 n=1 Tax=Ylistrum balloti TaxID=509963 RepID=UPI002905CD5C|nr:coiled-coil and C2 domain-containing protein 1-like isoform X2 [Ylistrum balloti]
MFGRKKETVDPSKRKGAGLMNQLGFGGDFGGQRMDDDEDDAALEAELLALQGEGPPKAKAKDKKGKTPVSLEDIGRMADDCMKDIGSDEEMSDTEDPDLMAELQELEAESDEDEDVSVTQTSSAPQQGVNMLSKIQERLSLYQQAKQAAKEAGDSSKQRRIDRGIKTLQDLEKKAKAGRSIPEDDIPPPVAVSTRAPPPAPSQAPVIEPTLPKTDPAPKPAPSTETVPNSQPRVTPANTQHSEEHNMLVVRQHQYKQAALQAKNNGDMTNAAKYVRIAKQFENVIAALVEGKQIDLSRMPPPPPGYGGSEESSKQVSQPPQVRVQRSETQTTKESTEENIPEVSDADARSLFKAPEAPTSVMDALTQRLQKYQSAESAAKEAGDSSKARRHGRIVKQYQDAIKKTKAGKPVNYDELPTPPGFAPIPVGNAGASVSAPASTANQRLQAPAGPAGPGTSPPKQRTPSPNRTPQPASKPAQRASVKKSPSTRAEQQAFLLRERMNEYRQAAVKAKKNNDLELAKKYMRIAKGFEPMIEAAESGLPVDMSQMPPSLTEEDERSFVMVSADECEVKGDRNEIFKKLEQDLINQIRMSAANHQHFTKLGDVLNSAKFQKMEQGCRKDLEALKNAFRHHDPVPKFHYENRTFSLVQCNTDLGDNDLEMTLVRGIQLPTSHAEKDLDTYVKYEFPYPTDDPQTGSSDTVKGSVNPEYNEPWKLQINRKSRGFGRVVERKSVKFEIYQKKGFFKGDKLIGTCNVKLLPLDSKCTYHDSYDLMDGRKAAGGKLEVKIRIRDPLKSKQVEETKEKWLVIDQFLKTLNSKPVAPTPPAKRGTTCIEVMRFEKQQLDQQINNLRDRLGADQLKALQNKSQLLTQRMDQKQAELKKGGKPALKAYVHQVEQEIPAYEEEARHFTKAGDMHKAQMMLNKIKHAEKELKAIRDKVPDL